MVDERAFLGPRYEYERDAWHPTLTPRQVDACRAVQALIDNNTLALESVPCLCGARAGELIASRDRFGFFYPLRLCGACGLLWQSRRFTAESLSDFYANWYRKVYDSLPERDVSAQWAAAAKRSNDRYETVRRRVRLAPGSVVADVGCNFGTLLARFQSDGMEIWGCDFGEEHLTVGRERLQTSNLLHGDASRLIEAHVKADLVTMDHVFEHFADPLAELVRIRSILAPGGRVFVSVPGTWWWTRNICSGDLLSLLQNAHTFQFDFASLCGVFEDAGFVLESGNEEIEAVFRLAERTDDGVPRTVRTSAREIRRRLRALERRRRLRRALRSATRFLGVERPVRAMLGLPAK